VPYIITTTTPTGGEPSLSVGKRTRRPVATDDYWEMQEEVAGGVQRLLDAHYASGAWEGRKAATDALLDAVYALPESGGTVGPLPDGTVIEVAPIAEHALREAVRPVLAERGPEYDSDDWLTMPLAGIIDVYSAAQG
jgi:hypothetical protein